MGNLIFYPIFAMVVLVYLVAAKMFIDRRRALIEKKVKMSAFANVQKVNEIVDSRSADHFRNLFEMPVLFYAVCLAIFATKNSSQALLVLAWVFVAARYAQAYVHCTYNRVFHRMLTFMAGCATLLVMWVLFILSIAAPA